MDTQNFAEEFTSQKPVDSPAEEPQNYGELFRVSKMGIYTQYSVWALVTNGGNHWVFCGSKALVQSLTTGGQSVVTFWVQDEREWRGRGRRGGREGKERGRKGGEGEREGGEGGREGGEGEGKEGGKEGGREVIHRATYTL